MGKLFSRVMMELEFSMNGGVTLEDYIQVLNLFFLSESWGTHFGRGNAQVRYHSILHCLELRIYKLTSVNQQALASFESSAKLNLFAAS